MTPEQLREEMEKEVTRAVIAAVKLYASISYSVRDIMAALTRYGEELRREEQESIIEALIDMEMESWSKRTRDDIAIGPGLNRAYGYIRTRLTPQDLSAKTDK